MNMEIEKMSADKKLYVAPSMSVIKLPAPVVLQAGSGETGAMLFGVFDKDTEEYSDAEMD